MLIQYVLYYHINPSNVAFSITAYAINL